MADWTKLLYTYGPFALLVLFIFVIEKKTRTALQDRGIPRRISVSVYLVNWCTIFFLCATVTYVWFQLNLPQEAMIQGTFENLREDETVFSESANLYLVRNYQRGKNQFSYNWRLIAPKRLPDGTKQSIYLNIGQGDNSRAFRYELTIRSSFYSDPVRLVYERKTAKVELDHEGRQEELAPTEDVSVEEINSPSGESLPVVHAQSSLDEIFKRLESDDPIIRRDARRDLAAQGPDALPRIESVLQDPKSSYRIRLGAIAALNGIPNASVSEKTRDAIVALSRDPDPVLSSEASRFVFKLPPITCGVRCGTERWVIKSLSDGEAQKVNFVPEQTTISKLIVLEAPNPLPLDRRIAPVEFQTYQVKALLLSYQVERDRDYHLVIADPDDSSKTMIAEIPDPQCSGVCASKQFSQLVAARDNFDKTFPEREQRFVRLNPPIPVAIAGVGFFDFHHGQRGGAPNAIELHPVLKIEKGQ